MNTPPLFTMPPPTQGRPRTSTWPLRVGYVAAVLSGAAILIRSVGPTVAQAPALAAVSAVLFGVFGAFCALLLNKIHYFGAPARRAAALAVLWGAAAAIGFALLANRAIHEHFAGRGDAQQWSLFAPFTEEPVKDLGVVVVLLLAATRFRTGLEGLVVGSFVGLGFEVVENVVQSLNNAVAASPPGHPGQWESLAVDVVHEVLRRSWTGHIVITGIAGFGIAWVMTAGSRVWRRGVGVALVLLAFAGHLLWNSHRFGIFYVVGQFGVLAVYLWLIRVGRSQESVLYRPYLAYAPVVDPALGESLATARSRRAYRKASPAPAPARRRQRAAARLAAAIGNGDAALAHECAERLARSDSGRSPGGQERSDSGRSPGGQERSDSGRS